MNAKNALLALSWIFLGAFASCGPECRVSSECQVGQHCDITRRECVSGCTSNADCPGISHCNVQLGRCDPGMLMIPDVGPLYSTDASTSTASADAGAGDAGN